MSLEKPGNEKKKLWWHLAPIFIAFWVALYFSVVMTSVNFLPDALKIKDETLNQDQFIAERAQAHLFGLTKFGPRDIGSEANEVFAVKFLLDTIWSIQSDSRKDLYNMEVDNHIVTGSYVLGGSINMYKGVQNVIVKFSPKSGAISENYLLVNSHFDTKGGGHGAGDAGAMIASMLEVLRVLSQSDSPLKHTVIFLFNGAEEYSLQAAHGFITQHMWANNCKALINLDAAGTKGREVLFQSGPKHPWLMRYYRKVVKIPFATTIGEEIFQAGLLPSDTDFRVFRDYGHVPGLDMALYDNGYNYHTKYDTFDKVPLGTLQSVGNNVLALIRGIANGPELQNPEDHASGHVVFYDVLGWFMVFYTEGVGQAINYSVSVISLIAIFVSLWQMSKRSDVPMLTVSKMMGIVFAIQLVSVILALGLNFAMAAFMDAIGQSLSWYHAHWTILGLYICPTLFGLAFLPSLYLEHTKSNLLQLNFKAQLFAHSNCIVMILFTIVLTALNIRSTYIFMMGVFFYTLALILNLATTLHHRHFLWILWTFLSQILPFLYFSSMVTFLLRTLIPMKARSGTHSNPELHIAGMGFVFAWLGTGFLIPILYLFKYTRTIVLTIFGVIILFIILAVTPLGFPFKEQFAPQRIQILHTNRIIHDYNFTVIKDEPVFYIYPLDRRYMPTVEKVMSQAEHFEALRVEDECANTNICKFPFYNSKFAADWKNGLYVPSKTNPQIPAQPTLRLLAKKIEENSKISFSFELIGPDRIGFFVHALGNSNLTDWSFNNTVITDSKKSYSVYIATGVDFSAMTINLEFEVDQNSANSPIFEIAIGGHWNHKPQLQETAEYQQFLDLFPSYAYLDRWISSYESWVY